jgi:cobalt/nickel transport system permease protein
MVERPLGFWLWEKKGGLAMHIPDGYLGPPTYGALWAAMVPAWLYASRRVKRDMSAAQIPHLAMASAFSLCIMIFAIPLPGGTTGHLGGSALIAILLGPWACVLAVSVALGIQAFIFGDGGITSLGANCFNMGLVGGLVGYLTYRLVSGSSFSVGDASGGEAASRPWRELVGAALAGYLAVNSAALFTALELGVQPLIHPASPNPQYFPYKLAVALPAVILPHLTAVGGLEAAVTVLVLGFVRKLQPKTSSAWKVALLLMAAGLLAVPVKAVAHEFWIEGKSQELLLVFGHGSNRAEFDLNNVKAVWALDKSGGRLSVSTEKRDKALVLRPSGEAVLVHAEVDNGYWCKTIYGWKNVGKSKASRVVEALRSLNYAKKLLAGGEVVTKPLEGAALEIVPLSDPFQIKEKDLLGVQVFFQGRPLPGVEVTGSDHQKLGTTDSQGMIKVPVSTGTQLIAVSCKEPLKGDPEADFLSITATLSFEVAR